MTRIPRPNAQALCSLVLTFVALAGAVGCGNSKATPAATDAASNAGATGLGGLVHSGGSVGAGGSDSGGGATGGQPGAGGSSTVRGAGGIAGGMGSLATGGALASGGAIAGAGRSGQGGGTSGGTSGLGGTNPSGGIAKGGNTGRGGTTPTGGAQGTGGSTSAGGTSGSAPLIRNDMFWKDSAGTPIYSQGGGVILVGDTYYWYGAKYGGAVSYAANPGKKNSDTSIVGVTIYASKDLANWKLENTVTFSNAGDWFGRMGVVYNANTKKYVLVAQGAGGLFFATSDTPTGNFTFDNVQTTLSGIANGSTGDQTTFQDDDGKAYLICSSSSGRSNLYVVPLRESDFLAIGTPTRIFGGAGREGNAMFKYDGHYYFCSSDLHGWNASHTYCISATNILGPYGTEFVMTNTDADFSHVTQTGFFITVKGSAQSFVIFAGDRWSDFAGNGLGYNQWMPLSFNGTTPIFNSLSEWSIDVATGNWAVGPNNNYAINPSFEADRVTVTTPAGWTATNGTNASGGHTGNWSWQLTGADSLDQQASGLPNGTYTLSAWVKGSGATGAQLYAKGFGGTDLLASLASANGTWANVSIPGIAVSNGKCDIGIATTAGTLTVDDFVLVKS
jgi:Glycosyl hydrolases family 43